MSGRPHQGQSGNPDYPAYHTNHGGGRSRSVAGALSAQQVFMLVAGASVVKEGLNISWISFNDV